MSRPALGGSGGAASGQCPLSGAPTPPLLRRLMGSSSSSSAASSAASVATAAASHSSHSLNSPADRGATDVARHSAAENSKRKRSTDHTNADGVGGTLATGNPTSNAASPSLSRAHKRLHTVDSASSSRSRSLVHYVTPHHYNASSSSSDLAVSMDPAPGGDHLTATADLADRAVMQYQLWTTAQQSHFLMRLLRHTRTPSLQFISSVLHPVLKRDFVALLPAELVSKILQHLPDTRSLCRCARVSRGWRQVVDGDSQLWKAWIAREGWQGRMDEDLQPPHSPFIARLLSKHGDSSLVVDPGSDRTLRNQLQVQPSSLSRHPYKALFVHYCRVRDNWFSGSAKTSSFAAHRNQVVTCLHLDSKQVISGSDDHSILVFRFQPPPLADHNSGLVRQVSRHGPWLTKTLRGHDGGVWCLQVVGRCRDVVISGSTDRTVRIWDSVTGNCLNVLRGHSSTIRCLSAIPETGHTPIGDEAPANCSDMPSPHASNGSSIHASSKWIWLNLQSVRELLIANRFPDAINIPLVQKSPAEHLGYWFEVETYLIVTGSRDKTLKIWRVELLHIPEQLRGILRAALAQDSPYFTAPRGEYPTATESPSADASISQQEVDMRQARRSLRARALSLMASSAGSAAVTQLAFGRQSAVGDFVSMRARVRRLLDRLGGSATLLGTENLLLPPILGAANNGDGDLHNDAAIGASSGNNARDENVAVNENDNENVNDNEDQDQDSDTDDESDNTDDDEHGGGHDIPDESFPSTADDAPPARKKYNVPFDVRYLTRTTLMRAMSGHTDSVRSIATCPSLVVSGSYDTTVRLWSLRDGDRGDCLHTLVGHTNKVYSVACNTSGTRACSGSMDATIRVWDCISGHCLNILEGHTSLVGLLQMESLGYLPPSPFRRYSNASRHRRDEPMSQPQSPSSPLEAELGRHPPPSPFPLSPSAASSRNAPTDTFVNSRHAGPHRGNVTQGPLGLDEPSATAHRRQHTGPSATPPPPQHPVLISAAADSTLRVWDPIQGRHINTLYGHGAAITCFAFDGDKCVSGSEGAIKLWDMRRGGTFVRDLLGGMPAVGGAAATQPQLLINGGGGVGGHAGEEISGAWRVAMDDRRCVVAVQRGVQTWLDVLDFDVDSALMERRAVAASKLHTSNTQ